MRTDKLVYVLAAMGESQAMALRINEQWCNQPGYATYFIERLGRQVAKRMSAAWAERIPESNNSKLNPVRNTVWAWDDLRLRLSQMHAPVAENKADWLILLSGLGLVAITCWLRALALELIADSQWLTPSEIDLAVEWEIENAVLSLDQDINSVADLYALFNSGISKPKQNVLDAITPIGWLVLVTGRMGLIDQNTKVPLDYGILKTLLGSDDNLAEAVQNFRDKTKLLAHRLVLPISESPDSEQWPFEYISDSFATGAFWDENFVNETFELLADLEYLCGFQITKINEASWRFESRDHKFTDAEGVTWKFQPWQIDFSDGRKPIALEKDGRYLSEWTETRSKDGHLLGVSAIGEHLGKFISKHHVVYKEPPEIPTTPAQVETFAFGDSASINQDEKKSQNGIPPLNEQENNNIPLDIYISSEKIRKNWQDKQNIVWENRQHSSGSHVRLAFMQWEVVDSYRHPLFELAMPTELEKAWFGKVEADKRKKERSDILNCAKERLEAMSSGECVNKVQLAQAVAEANQGSCWTYSEMLPSWAEHRRRKLLEEALRACDKFGVNVLVLPEYSVRPDTVKWLKAKLEQTSSQVSILAGTYRLYGRRDEAGFEECYSEILGLADFEKIRPHDRTLPEELMPSGERSAILSLLLPIKLNEQSLVSVFTRRKKYPAMAASEIFNPGVDPWQPLFTLDGLLKDLQWRDQKTGKRLTSQVNSISAEDIIKLLAQVKDERYLAELICSELFVITNPANWNNIASEYFNLLNRFLASKTIEYAKQSVHEDLWTFASYLGISGGLLRNDNEQNSSSEGNVPRRSIILLPSMTSRSADYWIFGQSALLAAGITTVFCNAVADKDSVGGSCVIGRESWKNGKGTPGISSLITPYSGWSRGIYYNEKKDALGEKEQAMVIVDIDPVHMMEGKPRPQALPVPLQLVAHLPITETINGIKKDKSKQKSDNPHFKSHEDLNEIVKTVIDSELKTKLCDPSTKLKDEKTLYELAKDLAPYFGDEKVNGKTVFEDRLDKWKNDWRELPYAGHPPAITDWLWVDLTPPEDENDLARVFVPPWGSDN